MLEIFNSKDLCDAEFKFDEACKTLRRLPKFGCLPEAPVDFEYPSLNQLKEMTQGKLIKLNSFTYVQSGQGIATI